MHSYTRELAAGLVHSYMNVKILRDDITSINRVLTYGLYFQTCLITVLPHWSSTCCFSPYA